MVGLSDLRGLSHGIQNTGRRGDGLSAKKIQTATEKGHRAGGSGDGGKLGRRIAKIGEWRFNYFLYFRWYGKEPETIEKFFSGLECIPIFMEIESQWAQPV